MPIEHSTRAITENKYLMQLFADEQSLHADIALMETFRSSHPNDPRVSDYAIKQKRYELEQIRYRIKGKDYSSVKTQCEQYFQDNPQIDKIRIIAETKDMIQEGKLVNEWPHLAAVFLLDHKNVVDQARQGLGAITTSTSVNAEDALAAGESIVSSGSKPSTKPSKPQSRDELQPVVASNQTPSPAGVNVKKEDRNDQKSNESSNDKKPTGEKVSEIFQIQQKILFKDGAYYLTGPKGNTRRVEASELLVKFNLPKNAPENLAKSVKMVEDFSLLLDAYIAANPNQKTKYDSAIKGIQELFAHQDIQTGKKVLDVTTITTGMFDNFWRTFSDTDLKKVNDAFRFQDPSARRLALMNFIRKNLGQSDLVLGKIMEQNPSYFAFPSDENILANSDLSVAGLSVGGRQSVEKVIRKAYLEAAGNWNKNYKEYIAQFKAQNPGVQVNEGEARKNNEKLTVLALAKREIMYQKLYNQNVTGDLALAQDIMGAKTLSMSDKSWDISTEIGGMIAMEAIAIAAGVVTAGAATMAINAAILGRNAYRGAKALEAYNAASKTRKAVTTTSRILASGASFEAGGATVRSLIENGDFTSMHSIEGYTQSIAMMGVMSGIGKLITAGKLGQGIQFKEGAGFAKNILPFTGQVVIEGTTIFGTSASIGSVIFDRKDNWTMEQMGQAMLMATLFKGAGKISASKNAKGEIEVKESRMVEVRAKEGTPYSERYILDGKEYRWSSKQNAFFGKNGESYTKEQFEALQAKKAPKIEFSQPSSEPNSKVSINKSLIERNQSLDDTERLLQAAKRLGMNFSESQKAALLEAHNADTVLKKGRILGRKGEFSKEETRILMEEGYAGRRQGLAAGVSSSHAEESHTSHGEKQAFTPKNLWKQIDTVLKGDDRKFREILPFADNNVWNGIGKLKEGEMTKVQAIKNSLAWIQNQTFSQIYKEMSKPYRGDHVNFLKAAGDNIRTLMISGESGKWMSAGRLGKLGVIVSAETLDYITSDEYTQGKKMGIFDTMINATGDFASKVILPERRDRLIKTYQEIILLNWVAILFKDSPDLFRAVTGGTKTVADSVGDRL